MHKAPPVRSARRNPDPPSLLRTLALWVASGYKAQLGASFLIALGITLMVMKLFPAAPRAFSDPGLGLLVFFVAPFVATAVALMWLGRRLRAQSPQSLPPDATRARVRNSPD